MTRVGSSYSAQREQPLSTRSRPWSRVLWWIAALSMATATTFAVPVHQIRMAGAILQGVIGQYGTPPGGSLAIHAIWQKDVTVNPPISAVTPAVTSATGGQSNGGASSGSSVAGYCQLHFSYHSPQFYNDTGGGSYTYTFGNIKEFRIHKDSDPDPSTDQVQKNPQWNQDSNHSWRADCGDPDPSAPNPPPMQYFDTSWSTLGGQNGT